MHFLAYVPFSSHTDWDIIIHDNHNTKIYLFLSQHVRRSRWVFVLCILLILFTKEALFCCLSVFIFRTDMYCSVNLATRKLYTRVHMYSCMCMYMEKWKSKWMCLVLLQKNLDINLFLRLQNCIWKKFSFQIF